MALDVHIPASFDTEALARHAQELHDRNFNCAQSVACTLAPVMGADEDLCFRLAEGLGGGLGKHTETCGALLGGALALGCARSNGCADPTSKLATYELVSQLAADFRAKHGTTTCSELRAQDSSGKTPMPICLECIDDALRLSVRILEALR